MKKWQALFLISFLAYVPVSAQVYHAGQSVQTGTPREWVEVSGGWGTSFSRLEDGANDKQLSHQEGISGRALFWATSWLGVGGEGIWFKTEKGIPMVPQYKMRRYGLITKWVLTPDTQPRAYLLLGMGNTKREFHYQFSPFYQYTETNKSSYGLAGAGLEVTMWRNLFLAGEIQLLYNQHKHVSEFFRLHSRFETGASLRAGLRF